MVFRALTASAALILSMLAPAGNAAAEGYPAKPVRLIVPFAAGGPTDVIARIVAQKLSESFGQQVVTENIPGAGGNTGACGLDKLTTFHCEELISHRLRGHDAFRLAKRVARFRAPKVGLAMRRWQFAAASHAKGWNFHTKVERNRESLLRPNLSVFYRSAMPLRQRRKRGS